MPKILTLLKKNRVCLNEADSQSDAKVCENKSIKLSKELGIYEDFHDDEEEELIWNESEKKKTLLDIDAGIKEIEKSLPCIKKAQTMSDMMQCSEGMH